jgi:hypothetical protein
MEILTCLPVSFILFNVASFSPLVKKLMFQASHAIMEEAVIAEFLGNLKINLWS